MNSTSNPNSLATSSITSASRRWLIETMIPRPIHLLITSAKLTSIRLASSLTLMNSVTCSLLSPQYLAHLHRPFPVFSHAVFCLQALTSTTAPASLACVSRIFSCISFSSMSLSSRRPPDHHGIYRLSPLPVLTTIKSTRATSYHRVSCLLFIDKYLRLTSFFSIGIRFRLLLLVFDFGRVSLSTGRSIFPSILGPLVFQLQYFQSRGVLLLLLVRQLPRLPLLLSFPSFLLRFRFFPLFLQRVLLSWFFFLRFYALLGPGRGINCREIDFLQHFWSFNFRSFYFCTSSSFRWLFFFFFLLQDSAFLPQANFLLASSFFFAGAFLPF